MKRFIFIAVLLIACNVSAQWSTPLNWMSPNVKNAIQELRDFGQLPYISGKWFYVDGENGSSTASGKDLKHPVATLAQAYDLCTTGDGDGILIISRTVSGTTNSTLLTDELTWAKYGITVIGVASPHGYFGRARVSHATGADSLLYLLNITGMNNTFININFTNEPENDGAPVSATAHVAAVRVAGYRNSFINCHIYCAAQSANAYKSDLILAASANEILFERCYIGSNSYDAGDNAASWIYLENATAAQRFFKNCTFLQQVSAGTAFGAVNSAGVLTLGGLDIYEDCVFGVFRANTHANICASWFIGTVPNTGNIILKDCVTGGFTALDAVGGNDVVWTNQPASNAAGGITVAP